MKGHNFKRKAIEASVFALAVGVLGLFFPKDPGLLGFWGLPYLLPPLIFAGFYGLNWGLASAGLCLFIGFFAVPSLVYPELWSHPDSYWTAFIQGIQISGPLALFGLMAMALFFVFNEAGKRAFLLRFRHLTQQNWSLQRKSKSLETVNRVLESRVAGQKDSFTLLRSQVKKLSSLNLVQALDTILETVQLFTEMKSGSIWALDSETGKLKVFSHRGWGPDKAAVSLLDVDSTIEGYVFRNGKPFSVRMLLGSQEFHKMNFQNNLITMPIRTRGKVWGILNIEDLPFEMYSMFTENVLEILLSLTEPYLADILDHEALYQQRENDEDTGFPLLTQLYRYLERDLERLNQGDSVLSLVVLEISNFKDLESLWPRKKLKRLFLDIKDTVDKRKGTRCMAFQFRQENQIAIVLPGMDQDGTSYFCLELISWVQELDLQIDGSPVPVELIIGFSSSKESQGSSETMIHQAEALLEMQRI